MIRLLKEKDIEAIALTHLLSWQFAFKNILSDHLLEELNIETFLETWRQIIKNKNRYNYIATSDNYPIAFISFGQSPEDENVAEIYGIYVNPNFWRQGFGNLLLKKALEELSILGYSSVILWVMVENNNARAFYAKNEFLNSYDKRTSQRKNEFFEEYKYHKAIL